MHIPDLKSGLSMSALERSEADFDGQVQIQSRHGPGRVCMHMVGVVYPCYMSKDAKAAQGTILHMHMSSFFFIRKTPHPLPIYKCTCMCIDIMYMYMYKCMVYNYIATMHVLYMYMQYLCPCVGYYRYSQTDNHLR